MRLSLASKSLSVRLSLSPKSLSQCVCLSLLIKSVSVRLSVASTLIADLAFFSHSSHSLSFRVSHANVIHPLSRDSHHLTVCTHSRAHLHIHDSAMTVLLITYILYLHNSIILDSIQTFYTRLQMVENPL